MFVFSREEKKKTTGGGMGRVPDSTNQQARAGACAHVTGVRPEEVRLIGDAQNLVYFNNVTCARACVRGWACNRAKCVLSSD